MNFRSCFAIALFAGCSPPAAAQEGLSTLPSVEVSGYVADCAHPSLPSQRRVGEWTGLQNFGQVYAARERLMAGIGRVCQRPGVGRVQVVMQASPARGEPRFVAIASEKR